MNRLCPFSKMRTALGWRWMDHLMRLLRRWLEDTDSNSLQLQTLDIYLQIHCNGVFHWPKKRGYNIICVCPSFSRSDKNSCKWKQGWEWDFYQLYFDSGSNFFDSKRGGGGQIPKDDHSSDIASLNGSYSFAMDSRTDKNTWVSIPYFPESLEEL